MNTRTQGSPPIRLAAILAIATVALAPSQANAQLAVTSAGTADGFSLTTFATMPQNGIYGAWGSAILANGSVVVNGYNVSNLGQTVNYVFNDVDGQSPATALHTSVWNDGSYASALAQLGSTVYGTHYGDNTTRIVNADGSEGNIISNVGRGGLGSDAARDSLLVATNAGIEEINLANSNPDTNHRVVASWPGTQVDGVTVSPDGQTVYAEVNGHILGYTISTGALVFDSGGLNAPDGVGVIASGSLKGDLIVNGNNGTVTLIDPTTDAQTIIASGGSRGDYVGFDTSNGTLFLSQSDRLDRLTLQGGTIGGGGSSGGGGATVPEPASTALLAVGLGGLLLRRRRRA